MDIWRPAISPVRAGAPKFGFKPDPKRYAHWLLVTVFCPDGYAPTPEAIFKAAMHWYYEQMAALERAAASRSETKPDNSLEGAVRAFSALQVPDLQQEYEQITNPTVHRLRNFLHQGKLNAYYFENDGRASVPIDFWATARADGVMESGSYWPFGRPSRWYETRPNYPLFLAQSELDSVLSEQPAKKGPLPKAKRPELAAALGKLDHLPNRKAQFEALCDMPEFRKYKITNILFREAARHVPRDPGRKSCRES